MNASDLLRELDANKTNAVICRRAISDLAILTENPAEAAALSKRDVDLLLEIMTNHREDDTISGIICIVLISIADGGGIAKLLDADVVLKSGAYLRAQLDAGNSSGALVGLLILSTLTENPRARTEMIREGILRHIVKALELFPGNEDIETTSHAIALRLRVSHRADAMPQLRAALAASPSEETIRRILDMPPESSPAPALAAPLPTVPPPSPFPVEAFEPAEIETVAIPAGGKSSDHAILCVLRHGALSAFALSEDTLTNYKTSPDWIVYRCNAGIEGFAISRNQVKGEPLRRFNLDVPIYLRHSDAQQIVKGQTYLLTEGAERVGYIASERLLAETEKMYKGHVYNEGMAVSADHCQDDKPSKVYNVSLVAFGAAEGGRRTRRRWTHRKATRRVGRSRRSRRL